MCSFQKALESSLREISEGLGHDVDIEHLAETISSVIPELADELGDEVLASIKEDAFSVGIERHREIRLAFEQRLMSFWKEPLDLLGVFISLATEAGSDFNSEFRNESVRKGDAVFEALTRLHGKACQVSKETLVLLRSGYADGAHARWRTLHELAVVACLISKHGQELAERYLLHRRIQRYKSALQYQKHCEGLGEEPLPQEEINAFREERDWLVDRFGPLFKEDYGWAASVTHPAFPNLAVLEECVDLEHWRPYYRLASDSIHPNSHGTYFRLGLSSNDEDVILAGPTYFGLADPGHSTAISLNLLTTVLLARKPTMDYMVYSKVLLKLADEIGDTFLAAHHAVKAQSAGKGRHY